MEIIQVAGLGLITTFLVLAVKEQSPVFAFSLALFVGVVIFIFLATKIGEVIGILKNLAHLAKVNDLCFALLFP